MALLDRFFKYVKIDTMSDDKNDFNTPSTQKQFDLAYVLKKELEELGLKDIILNEYATLYATLPANSTGFDTIGFFSSYGYYS